VCESYRRWQTEEFDIPTFAESLKDDGLIGNGGRVMQPSASVLAAHEQEGCEPFFGGPGNWLTACDIIEALRNGDAEELSVDEHHLTGFRMFVEANPE